MTHNHPVWIDSPAGDPAVDAPLLKDIREFLGREEVVNTILLAGFLARDGLDPMHPVLAARGGDDIIAVCSLTPGFFLLLSHVEYEAAIGVLAAELVRRRARLPGVMGPPGPALAFAEQWTRLTGGSFRPGMSQRILAARSVRPPEGVPGIWRHMEPADHPLLVSWFTAFNIEADGVPADVARSRGQAMLDRLDERSGGLLWLDEGRSPVSIACYKAPTMNGIRIGPVYTPPEHRRRGYAGAVTAATTQLMLDRGHAFVCLYTDAANATANHVYEAIGYEFVADSMQYRFTGSTE